MPKVVSLPFAGKGDKTMVRLTSIKFTVVVGSLIGLMLFLISCSQESNGKNPQTSPNVTVKADVSLKLVLEEIAGNYRRESQVPVNLELAPSFDLLADSSADSVDLYIFVNGNFVEAGSNAGLVDSAGEITLAYAVPCILVPKFNPFMVSNLSDLEDSKMRIGISDPASDILGRFALEIFRRNKLDKVVQHRLTIAGPSALELAERVAKNELDAAIGWTICSNWNPGGIEVVLLVPSEIPRVATVCAVKAAAPPDSVAVSHFMTYLKSDRGLQIFRKWGYLISESDLSAYAPAAVLGGSPE